MRRLAKHYPGKPPSCCSQSKKTLGTSGARYDDDFEVPDFLEIKAPEWEAVVSAVSAVSAEAAPIQVE